MILDETAVCHFTWRYSSCCAYRPFYSKVCQHDADSVPFPKYSRSIRIKGQYVLHCGWIVQWHVLLCDPLEQRGECILGYAREYSAMKEGISRYMELIIGQKWRQRLHSAGTVLATWVTAFWKSSVKKIIRVNVNGSFFCSFKEE